MNENIGKYLRKGYQAYLKLSGRERAIVGGAILVGVLMLMFETCGWLIDCFDAQSLRMKRAEASASGLPVRLERYFKLRMRKEQVEQSYKQVQIPEGARSHLESLLSSKSGIDKQIEIKPITPMKLGEDYEQLPFVLRFRVTDYAQLIAFLKELVGGAKPMILKRLDLTRAMQGQRLEVELEVSTVRRITA